MFLHTFLLVFVFSFFFVGTTMMIWHTFDTNSTETVVEEPKVKYTTIQGSVLSVADAVLKIQFGTKVDILLTKDTEVYFTAVQNVDGKVLSQVAVEGGVSHIPVGSTITVKVVEENGSTIVAERIDYIVETEIDAKEYANKFFLHNSYIKVNWVGVENGKITATTTSVVDSTKVATFTFNLPNEDVSIYEVSDTSKNIDALHAHALISVEDIAKGQEVYLLLDTVTTSDKNPALKAVIALPMI